MNYSKSGQSLDGNEGKITLAIIGVVAIGVALYVVTNAPPGVESAKVACKSAVKDRLASPASADFVTVKASWVDEDELAVWGEVDADNKFGAAIRSEYGCDLSRADSGWSVEDVEIHER